MNPTMEFSVTTVTLELVLEQVENTKCNPNISVIMHNYTSPMDYLVQKQHFVQTILKPKSSAEIFKITWRWFWKSKIAWGHFQRFLQIFFFSNLSFYYLRLYYNSIFILTAVQHNNVIIEPIYWSKNKYRQVIKKQCMLIQII